MDPLKIMWLEVAFFTLNFYSFWIGICLLAGASTNSNCNRGNTSPFFDIRIMNGVMAAALAFSVIFLAIAIPRKSCVHVFFVFVFI